MKTRCLIVDDNELVSGMLRDIAICIFGEDIHISAANSLHMAMKNLEKPFDLVLCDNFLKDGLGSDFVNIYADNYQRAKIIFYSSEKECVDKSLCAIHCRSIEAVRGELVAYYDSLNFTEPETISRNDTMGEIVSKEVCNEKHKNTDDSLIRIEAIVEKVNGKLDKFNMLAITTLLSALSAIAISCLKH